MATSPFRVVWARGVAIGIGDRDRRGTFAALAAALLFGLSMPLAKRLLDDVDPWMMAALLYAGSGLGLFLGRLAVGAAPVSLSRADLPWLVGANAVGGVIAPVLLMIGLDALPASTTALLLNSDVPFTALVAWWVFKENIDRRAALGMAAVMAGVAVLSWPAPGEGTTFVVSWPACAVLGACLCWAVDNNLTRRIALVDAAWLAAVKGTTAGAVNLVLALLLGSALPAVDHAAAALLLGFVSYGLSLALFVVGLRELGAARASTCFALAPFCGAAFAIALGEPASLAILFAALLMACGVWLHFTEHHAHLHSHEPMEHAHMHVHDLHHQHAHEVPVAPGVRHHHVHHHTALTHSHVHYPDAHHRHEH